jgi:hypothetical protein
MADLSEQTVSFYSICFKYVKAPSFLKNLLKRTGRFFVPALSLAQNVAQPFTSLSHMGKLSL